MKKFIQFNIPLTGLKVGTHQFDYQIDKSFFEAFEEPLYNNATLEVGVTLDKEETVCTFDFLITGSVETNCDRCLELYKEQIETKQQLLLKYSEEPREEEEVIYILPGTASINLAHFIYEFICLAMPMKKVHPEVNGKSTCNKKVLEYLSKKDEPTENENPIWDELKKLKK